MLTALPEPSTGVVRPVPAGCPSASIVSVVPAAAVTLYCVLCPSNVIISLTKNSVPAFVTPVMDVEPADKSPVVLP
jgi:hypothetical protein